MVVLRNGRYAIMDVLAERFGHAGPWPGFADVDIAGVAAAFGCRSVPVRSLGELRAATAELLPTLPSRREPLLLDVEIPEG